MSVSLRYTGLAEMYADLRALPAHLRTEGAAIVVDEGAQAFNEIIEAYPSRTGNLKRGMKLETHPSEFGMRVILRNVAKHAWLYENGTQVRHTDLGQNRGFAHPAHVFVPRIIRHRRAMYARLAALLASTGLKVTGDAAA